MSDIEDSYGGRPLLIADYPNGRSAEGLSCWNLVLVVRAKNPIRKSVRMGRKGVRRTHRVSDEVKVKFELSAVAWLT